MPKKKVEKEVKGSSDISFKYYSIILVVILALFLVGSSFFYLMNSKNFRRSDLVGDAICGNFGSEETQDKCCSDLHQGDIRDALEGPGDWQYISGMKKCQYVYLGALPSCTEEAKVCPNGKTVVRDSEDDCRFKPC